MNTRNSAIVLNSKGETKYLGYVSMQRGCPQTRNFAMNSNTHVPQQGVSLVIGEKVTPEALRRAIQFLEIRLGD